MSFDIVLQGFEDGEAAPRDGRAVRDLVLGAADRIDPQIGTVSVETADGAADVYGVPQEGAAVAGLLFNHVAGTGFDLLVAAAKAADLVIMPVGCPTCVVDDAQRRHLPAELADDRVELVTTGAELLGVIEAA